jgi:ribosomal protein L37AE/L43A
MRSPAFEYPVAHLSRPREQSLADQKDDQPHRCPSCASSSIVATSKTITANSYWRCDGCGEVWSPSRRLSTVPRSWRA